MVKKMKFTISPDGEISISVEGAVGKECETMTAPFEALLGDVSKKTYKNEYYQQNENTVQTEVGQGDDS